MSSMLPKGEVKLIAQTVKQLCIVRHVCFFAHNQRRAAECYNDLIEEHKLLAGEKNWILF